MKRTNYHIYIYIYIYIYIGELDFYDTFLNKGEFSMAGLPVNISQIENIQREYNLTNLGSFATRLANTSLTIVEVCFVIALHNCVVMNTTAYLYNSINNTI